jgi:LuxR family transcriptional regulator, maltose regulon positive regulatory protein
MTPVSSFPLLRTKLNRPVAAGAVIVRPRLLQKLMPALERKLTLVAAPAGFGKTTVLVQWLAGVSLPSAWISLDEHDGDVSIFLAYLVEAIRSLFPEACPDTLMLVRAPREIPLTHVAYTLINEIAALPGAFILVLDDYHLVRTEAIHQLLTTLVSHAPQNLHLVLSTRADPPLPLARLRARQELTELRAADLRFQPAEVEAFLTQTMALALDTQAMALLERETEGWAVGLQLTALSLREVEDTQHLLDELARGEHGHVMDFLVSEVLDASAPGLQDFLHWTALFERFCPALCDALGIAAAPDQGAGNLLAAIERANLFVVRLDSVGKWFRYHHLFRGLLRLRLADRASPEAIADMHRRASRWFAVEGWTEEALGHALAAEDAEMAADIVERSVPVRLNGEDWRGAERLLGRLPEEVVQRRPALLLARAWILATRLQPEGLPALVAAAEAQLSAQLSSAMPGADGAALGAQLCALRAAILQDDRVMDYAGSLALATRALEELPRSTLFVRRFAMAYFTIASQRLGRQEEALVVLNQIQEREGASVNTFTEGVGIMLQQLLVDKGDLDRMEQVARRTLHPDSRSNLVLSKMALTILRAAFLFFRYRLPEARSVLEDALRTPYGARPGIVFQAYLMLALIHELLGNTPYTDEAVGNLAAYLAQDGAPGMQRILESFGARLNLMRGNVDAAAHWAAKERPQPRRIFNDDIESPVLTYAAVRIAQATPASLAEAHRLLRELDVEMARTHYTRRRVQVALLLAMACAAQGDESASLTALRQAVELARPGRIVIYFVEQGELIRRLLLHLARQTPGDGFIRELLEAFPIRTVDARPKTIPIPPADGLSEDLTPRETEILRMLEQGWSNAEIAGALVLSPLTVKRHIANLYQKLGVNSRTRAVRRSRELGILPAGPDGGKMVRNG